MKRHSIPLTTGAAAIVLAGILTSCINIKIQQAAKCPPPEDSCCGSGSAGPTENDGQIPGDPPAGDPPGPPPRGGIGVPTGTSGTLNSHINSSTPNQATGGCFLKKSPHNWDRYISVPALFLGPGATPVPGMPNVPNDGNLTWLTVKTCNASNVFFGAGLRTGIVIYRDDDPSIKKCRTNALQCTHSPLLTTNSYAMSPGCYYRATVYYKSSTLPSTTMTNISVNWQYD